MSAPPLPPQAQPQTQQVEFHCIDSKTPGYYHMIASNGRTIRRTTIHRSASAKHVATCAEYMSAALARDSP